MVKGKFYLRIQNMYTTRVYAQYKYSCIYSRSNVEVRWLVTCWPATYTYCLPLPSAKHRNRVLLFTQSWEYVLVVMVVVVAVDDGTREVLWLLLQHGCQSRTTTARGTIESQCGPATCVFGNVRCQRDRKIQSKSNWPQHLRWCKIQTSTHVWRGLKRVRS